MKPSACFLFPRLQNSSITLASVDVDRSGASPFVDTPMATPPTAKVGGDEFEDPLVKQIQEEKEKEKEKEPEEKAKRPKGKKTFYVWLFSTSISLL